jgi:hypothetical protein
MSTDPVPILLAPYCICAKEIPDRPESGVPQFGRYDVHEICSNLDRNLKPSKRMLEKNNQYVCRVKEMEANKKRCHIIPLPPSTRYASLL